MVKVSLVYGDEPAQDVILTHSMSPEELRLLLSSGFNNVGRIIGLAPIASDGTVAECRSIDEVCQDPACLVIDDRVEWGFNGTRGQPVRAQLVTSQRGKRKKWGPYMHTPQRTPQRGPLGSADTSFDSLEASFQEQRANSEEEEEAYRLYRQQRARRNGDSSSGNEQSYAETDEEDKAQAKELFSSSSYPFSVSDSPTTTSRVTSSFKSAMTKLQKLQLVSRDEAEVVDDLRLLPRPLLPHCQSCTWLLRLSSDAS